LGRDLDWAVLKYPAMTTSLIFPSTPSGFKKSLLNSLCLLSAGKRYKREEQYPSLAKRGEGRFCDPCQFNSETLNKIAKIN
jgi:hypothetical protein